MPQEEAQYLARSLKAALNSAADLVPCARPGCEGAAVAGKGAPPQLLSFRLLPYPLQVTGQLASQLPMEAPPQTRSVTAQQASQCAQGTSHGLGL